MRGLVPILVAAALLGGCGGSSAPSFPRATPLAATCGSVPRGLTSSTFWLRTSDGVRLYAASAGNGTTAVVLVHESGGAGLCGWLPTMRRFSGAGLRTVAIDLRGYPPSGEPRLAIYHRYAPDLQAAVDAAHALNAKTVLLMGASLGGAAVVAEAPALHGISGVVSLSGELQLPTSELDAIGAAPRLRQPLLVVASRDDGYLDAADAHKLVRAAGSTDKRAVIYPGTYHGWDLLDVAPYRARVRATLLGWLHAHGS